MSSQSATNASAPNATAKYRAQAPRSSDEWLDLGPGWLFDSIRDAVVVAHADTGRIALWNPVASQLFGYTPSEALGVVLSDLIDDLHETPEWAAARSDGSTRQTVELFARSKDGREVCVEPTACAILRSTGAARHPPAEGRSRSREGTRETQKTGERSDRREKSAPGARCGGSHRLFPW